MNDENKIGLSIEMYEDLKETLVKAVKSTKANAGLENAQLERIERLIEAAERSQAQLAGRLEVIDKEIRQTHTLIEQVRQAVEAAVKPENLPVREHRHTYTLDISSSKTFLTMFVMLGCIFLQGAFIYRISENNRLLAANDLKYRYVKMRGEIKEKELMELETIFRDEQHTAIRDTVRNQVERYEEAVRRRAEQLERAASKERKAYKLLQDAEHLRKK